MGIRVGRLDGTGTASTLFGGESTSLFAALLKAARDHQAPGDLRRSKGGQGAHLPKRELAPDLLGRSCTGLRPVDYQWKRNGSNIATGPTFTPTLTGDYTCTVTATNLVGRSRRPGP